MNAPPVHAKMEVRANHLKAISLASVWTGSKEPTVNTTSTIVFQTLAKMREHAMMDLTTTPVIVLISLWVKIAINHTTHVP